MDQGIQEDESGEEEDDLEEEEEDVRPEDDEDLVSDTLSHTAVSSQQSSTASTDSNQVQQQH